MKTEKLYVIAFSPTGTSRAVASAIASGTGICETEYIDLGKPGSKPEITLPENVVAVISVPVYGGMAAPVAMERLAGIKGVGTPVVLTARTARRWNSFPYLQRRADSCLWPQVRSWASILTVRRRDPLPKAGPTGQT